MRLVSIGKVADKMFLARTLYDGRGMMILPVGANLSTHKSQLLNFNIQYLYVTDDLSEGIEMSQLLSEETRIEIHTTIKRLKKVYQPVADHKSKTFFDLPYMKLGKMIADDITSQNTVHIDVTELLINRVYEFDHDLNVGIVAALIGRAFGMPRDDIYHLAMGGFLHDLGLLALPDEIMVKFGKNQMDFNEQLVYKQYPLIGYNMIKHNNVLNLITKSSILQHKERYDGTGYPGKKKGDGISMGARIVGLANAFEKLYFSRDPGLQLKIFDIVRHILKDAGQAFDPAVVSVFIKHLEIFPNGTMVKLNDGRMGLVERQNEGQIARPVVRAISKDGIEVIDLLKSDNPVIEDIAEM